MKNIFKAGIILLSLILIGCSNGKSPIEPAINDYQAISDYLPDSDEMRISERSMVAAYDAVIDPVAETFTITPVNERDAQYHFPLTQLYPNCLKITGYGFTPNFWADIKLTHPMPGSGIDGFDPRVIAIFPANDGFSFNYPSLGLTGNNGVLFERDGYTKLFDSLGGSIPGNANPFVAYFKDQPYRMWTGRSDTTETKRWQMDLDGFGGNLQFKLVVDVSTNYPFSPLPVLDNAPEPVAISVNVGQGFERGLDNTDITVTLLDWQGPQSVGAVQVEAPDLFDGLVNLEYTGMGQYPNEYVYTGIISNEKQAPGGEYRFLVAASDKTTGTCIYNEFTTSILTSGNLIWAKRAGGSSYDYSEAITTLSDNSVVVSGYFAGTATFGPDEPNQTVLTSAGYSDIFIARYNPDGTLSWAKRAGGTDDDWEQGITTLSDNSVVVTGGFYATSTFGEGEPAETMLTSAGQRDVFIARYNPDGTLQWAKRAGGIDGDRGNGITTLSDDSTVITGGFSGTATFGPDEPNQTLLTSAGEADICIARYNPDGTLQWAKRAGGSSYDNSEAITTLSDNSVVVTGDFLSTATFGEGESNETMLTSVGGEDIFVARYNPNGTLAWAKRAGSLNGDAGYGITNLSDNTTVVTGAFNGTAVFGQGEPNQTILYSDGSRDIFIARYNPDGTLAWAKRAGGSIDDYGLGITTLSFDSIAATGYFQGTTIATFGSGEPNETILSSAGNADIFIAKYNSDGTLQWAKRAGGIHSDYGNAITSLSDDSIFVTGYFSDIATFGPEEQSETVLTSADSADIFIARFQP